MTDRSQERRDFPTKTKTETEYNGPVRFLMRALIHGDLHKPPGVLLADALTETRRRVLFTETHW